METAAEAKAKRGPKATIRRQLTRVHTPATSLSKAPHITSLLAARRWLTTLSCSPCKAACYSGTVHA